MRRSRGRNLRLRAAVVPRAFAAALIAAALILPAVATPVAAADPPPDRVEGQQVYDDGLLGETLLPTTQQLVDLMAKLHDVNVDRASCRAPRRRTSAVTIAVEASGLARCSGTCSAAWSGAWSGACSGGLVCRSRRRRGSSRGDASVREGM